MNDDLDHHNLDDRSLKEPMPGTSRGMMDLDAQHMINDDGFGTTSSFGRKHRRLQQVLHSIQI